jgi:23S rRNA (uracil1939-C5)-methyltransferase
MDETRELVIARLGAQADGIAETADGPVYVPFALPGERVRAAVGEGGRARLLEVLQPAADRVRAPCRHFGMCGGCALQHLDEGAIRAWKREQVRVAFAQRGMAADVEPTVAIAGGRRRAVFAARRRGSGVVLGFHAARGHEIVGLSECPVLVPEIVAALPALLRLAEPLLPREAEARIIVLAADNGLDVAVEDTPAGVAAEARARLARAAAEAGVLRVSVGGEPVYAAGVPVLRFGTALVEPPPGAFVQAVAEAEAAIAARVLGVLPKKAKRVADLFCGLGAFAFPLARRAEVLAVDGDGAAMAALAAAARRTQGIKRIETRVRDLFREPLGRTELAGFDAVVLDPPRAGAAAQAARLAAAKVPIVVAVSCNPATLARDARLLVDGGYRLTSVTPIDQFRYSAHVEAVAVFRR